MEWTGREREREREWEKNVYTQVSYDYNIYIYDIYKNFLLLMYYIYINTGSPLSETRG